MLKFKSCPHCGNAVREEAGFCLDCGRRIDSEEDDARADIRELTEKIEAVVMDERAPLDSAAPLPDREAEKEAEIAPAAFFKIESGADKGQNIPLRETVYIGRLKRRDGFQVSDPYASREHAVIERSGERFILKNLSETNGTTVNGHLAENHPLAAGDVVEIGYTVMTFHSNTD